MLPQSSSVQGRWNGQSHISRSFPFRLAWSASDQTFVEVERDRGSGKTADQAPERDRPSLGRVVGSGIRHDISDRHVADAPTDEGGKHYDWCIHAETFCAVERVQRRQCRRGVPDWPERGQSFADSPQVRFSNRLLIRQFQTQKPDRITDDRPHEELVTIAKRLVYHDT